MCISCEEPVENNIWQGIFIIKSWGLKYMNFYKGIKLDLYVHENKADEKWCLYPTLQQILRLE